MTEHQRKVKKLSDLGNQSSLDNQEKVLEGSNIEVDRISGQADENRGPTLIGSASRGSQKSGEAGTDGRESFLERVDMFKQPITYLTLNGQRSRKTSLGGLFTLVTIFLFSLMLYLKIELASYREARQAEGRSQTPLAESFNKEASGRSLHSFGDQSFTEKNIRFTEQKEVDLTWMNYTEFIDPFKQNLNKISIIFNDGGRRETLEESMYLPNQIGASKDGIRSNDLSALKGDWPDNRENFAKFLRYEISTSYQNKNENSTQEITKLHKYDSMKNIYMNGGDDPYSIFPRIDITDYIYLMGDVNSDDYESMKAYTQFKIKLNWLEIQKEAFTRTQDWMQTNAKAGYDIDQAQNDAWCP